MNLALVSLHLAMFSRDEAWSFYFSTRADIRRSFLKSLKKLLPNGEAFSARTPLSSPSLLSPPGFLPLCLQSNGSLEEWSTIWLEGRLVLAWVDLPWVGGDYSNLHTRMRVSPRGGDDPSPSMIRGQTWQPSQEANRTDFQVVMWARCSLGEVVDVHHREQGGVQGVEHKMGLVPAAIFYPAGVF